MAGVETMVGAALAKRASRRWRLANFVFPSAMPHELIAGGAAPAVAAGASLVADLQAFDVLQVGSVASADLTGTTVTADSPVEVFAGCVFCVIGSSGADHMQEVMLPVAWWGTTAVGAASNPFTSDVNSWRIVASEDGTTVSTEPVMPWLPCDQRNDVAP